MSLHLFSYSHPSIAFSLLEIHNTNSGILLDVNLLQCMECISYIKDRGLSLFFIVSPLFPANKHNKPEKKNMFLYKI